MVNMGLYFSGNVNFFVFKIYVLKISGRHSAFQLVRIYSTLSSPKKQLCKIYSRLFVILVLREMSAFSIKS